MKKFQINNLIYPNKIHLIVKSICIHKYHCRWLRDESTIRSFHFHWYKEVFGWLNYQLYVRFGWIISYLYAKLVALILLMSNIPIQLLYRRTCPISKITTYPESSVKAVAPVHIGAFTCFIYKGTKVDTGHPSNLNEIGQICLPKKWVSS